MAPERRYGRLITNMSCSHQFPGFSGCEATAWEIPSYCWRAQILPVPTPFLPTAGGWRTSNETPRPDSISGPCPWISPIPITPNRASLSLFCARRLTSCFPNSLRTAAGLPTGRIKLELTRFTSDHFPLAVEADGRYQPEADYMHSGRTMATSCSIKLQTTG